MSKKTWITIYDGGSDEWLYVRRGSARVFYFVSVLDMHAATGEDHGDRYCGEVKMVDLDAIGEKEIASALRSCGFDPDEIRDGWDRDLAIAECCQSYGCYAPLHSESGGNRREQERSARRAANEFASDDSAREAALDRPVNALGSTASEYMRGDLDSALQRGVESGDRGARIMAKMYGVPDQVIDDTRPEDFLPYVMGYMAAMQGSERETRDGIVPEYHRGYERGTRVKAGECPAPSWIKTSGMQVNHV